MKNSKAIAATFFIAATAALVIPPSASATVTIGSNLARTPTQDYMAPTTAALIGLSPGAAAPGGIVSPVNGTITTWRIRNSPTGGGGGAQVKLRVLRPAIGGSAFTGGGSSIQVQTGPGITTFNTPAIPISTGDYIGIDCCPAIGTFGVPGAGTTSIWGFPGAGFLADGATRAPDSTQAVELAINATIEPTSAVDVKSVKSLKKGRLRVTVGLPNRGSLTVADARSKKKLLRSTGAQASRPGEVTLLVRSTSAGRAALKRRVAATGRRNVRVKAKLKLSFTPAFGNEGVTVRKVKLRP